MISRQVIMLSLYKSALLQNEQNKEDNRKKVVVFGTGWAGRSFVSTIDKKKFNVTVVSPRIVPNNKTKFVSQPNYLSSLNGGSFVSEFELPKDVKQVSGMFGKGMFSSLLFGPKFFKIGFEQESGQESGQEFEQEFEQDYELDSGYDHIVFALGSEVNTFGIEGVDTHCFYYKTEEDANKLKKMFEEGKLNKSSNVAVLGGGILGIELSCALKTKCDQVSIFEMDPNLLPIKEFDSDRETLMQYVESQGIRTLLNHTITKVCEKDGKTLVTFMVGKISKDGGVPTKTLEFDAVIYTCGVKPSSEMKTKLNFKSVNRKLQVITKDDALLENVYAIGDCNSLVPQSAQNAKQQGIYLANTLNNDTKCDYVFKSIGTVIKLNRCVYIKSNYYSGFGPAFVHNIISLLNL